MSGFKIIKRSKKYSARQGKIMTPHGIVRTPNFMPIGTRGAVKLLSSQELKQAGAQIILANTYHLFFEPGIEVLKKFRGLRNFMKWPGPILTDSGGFQVFSLNEWRQVLDYGVRFHHPKTGKEIVLTPEKVIDLQKIIDSDIFMPLDECIPYDSSYKKAEKAVKRTICWAKQSKKAFRFRKQNRPLLFAIVQGGKFLDLREKCAKELINLDFDGYALGGLAVGEPFKETRRISKKIVSLLPSNKPRYLMGLGVPSQLVWAVLNGFDIFDCVLPTRNGRHGLIYIFKRLKKWRLEDLLKKKFYQKISIGNSVFKNDKSPLDKKCGCFACQNYSRAYIHHLFKIKDPLGQRLAVIHNIYFYLELFKKIRELI